MTTYRVTTIASHTRRSPAVCAGGTLLVLALAACGEPASPTSRASAPTHETITLITGDRITRMPDGSPRIEPGPGRGHLAFTVRNDDGELTVIPEDVVGLLDRDALDPALFNVTQLLAHGYGDDRREDLPIIITGAADLPALRSRMATPGTTITHVLPTLRAIAARQGKASAGAMLAMLATRGDSAATSSAPPKIWLDRRRKALLDRSVPQIGAPAAYARGFTGAGVTVAVIDSGIDATHPDLAGQVVAAKSFVDDGHGAMDLFGHGTEVASVIAGTGAASNGQFHGVAPGARLVVARVIDASGGGDDSRDLAAMEWAVVTQHARIVNMSLGYTDNLADDPLEQAVNQLSAEFGTLFVVAAGNSGRTAESIDSPASADAALAVGAVNRNEQRAGFSSQGPRIGDHAIKPEITAPGVSIVMARAAGTSLGEPVGDFYASDSGTSMAAPHVAGAAAILLQQHPTWTGSQLKAALINAAQPNPRLTVYQQGAGRVDADRATRQAVTSEPAVLNLGRARFPHDDDPIITRTVRYDNAGAEAIVLTVEATASAQAMPAPPGMVTVSPATIIVPAGGSAEVALAIDTRINGPDQVYGGTLVATGADTRVITPLGFEREVESYDLTVNVIGRDGQPASGSISITGLGGGSDAARAVRIRNAIASPGRSTYRLPKGTYAVETLVSEAASWLVAPRQPLAADAELVMDSRLARPIDVTLPEPDLVTLLEGYRYQDVANNFVVSRRFTTKATSAEIGPSAPPGEIQALVTTVLAPTSEQPSRVYALAHELADHVPTGWRQTIRLADLAIVHARHAARAGHVLAKGIFTFHGVELPYPGPFQLTEHYYGPGIEWTIEVNERDLADTSSFTVSAIDSRREYRAGQHYTESMNRAPFGPGFPGSGSPDDRSAQRVEDTLTLAPSLFSDQSVPAANNFTTVQHGTTRLRRDGQVIAAASEFPLFPVWDSSIDLEVEVPPARAQYRLEADATRPGDLSTHVSAAWTFTSEHVDGAAQVLPLPALRFFPRLDEHNETAAPLLVLPIEIERPAGAIEPDIARAQVDVSFDDGATWAPLPIARFGNHAVGLVLHPPGARYASLRGSAADVDGNAVEQTIIRAYALAAP